MAAIIMHVTGNGLSCLQIFKPPTVRNLWSMFHAKQLIILPNSSFPLDLQLAGPGQVFHFLHLLSSVGHLEHSYELLQAFLQSFRWCSVRNNNFVFKYTNHAEQILLQDTSAYSYTDIGLHVKINTPHIRINLFYKAACTKTHKDLQTNGFCRNVQINTNLENKVDLEMFT